MAEKKKIYLDTSVPSAVFDLGKPKRLMITKNWLVFASSEYIFHTSDLSLKEIQELLSVEKKHNILNLIQTIKTVIIKTNNEAVELSDLYIKKGAIPETEPEDALHLAIAVVHKIPFFVSWDYKHIVSKNPMRKIEEINQKAGYGTIKIGSLYDFV